MGGHGQGEVNWEIGIDVCALLCINSQWKYAVYCRMLSSVLCGDPDGWDGGGQGSPSGRGCVYTQTIHFIYSRN